MLLIVLGLLCTHGDRLGFIWYLVHWNRVLWGLLHTDANKRQVQQFVHSALHGYGTLRGSLWTKMELVRQCTAPPYEQVSVFSKRGCSFGGRIRRSSRKTKHNLTPEAG